MKNRKKTLLAIGCFFFAVLYFVLQRLSERVIVTDAGERLLMIIPEGVIVTDAGEQIYWVLSGISVIAVPILGILWNREITKKENDSAAKEDTDTEDSSAC